MSGYVFVAPYFGYRSKTEYDEKENKFKFATVDVPAFVMNQMSGGLTMGHSKAVQYNFPEEVLKRNPEIVAFNTVNMSNALTPTSPRSQFSNLSQFGLWIGDGDEAFDPKKIINFAETNKGEEADFNIKLIKDENHFSIILKAHQLIGPWIMGKIKK